MKTVANYSPKIKILSLILSFLIVFYLVPTAVYADGLNNDTSASSNTVSEAEESGTHISNDGLEGYYPTQTHSLGSGGVGSVNLSTGNLTIAIPTLTTTDSLFAFTPTLVYNSSLASKYVTSEYVDTPFDTSYMPKGFKLNIQETVIEKSYTDENNVSHTYFSLYDSDGTTHYFYPNEDSTEYYDDSGLRLTLTFSGDDIKIEDTSETVRTYSVVNESAWHLTSITDKYGNQLMFEFNTSYQPTKVIIKPNGSSAIEMLSLLYDNDKLIAVYNDSSKDSVIFSYTNGNLSMVYYCYGNDNTTEQDVRDAYSNSGTSTNVTYYERVLYGYDSNGYATYIRVLGLNRVFRYETLNGKVSKITEYAINVMGQQISYTYGEGYTDVRSTGNDETLNTEDDIITRYIFDGNGRAISTYSMSVDGSEIYGATAGTYEDGQLKNNLKGSVVLNGVDPEDIIENESSSNEYFTTIQGGADTDETTGTYTQTVLLVENPASLTESNANVEYIISGFGYSNSILQDDNSKFSLGVNVYYYQGVGEDVVVVSYEFDFANVENAWQYVCGKFNCNLESTETANYDYVSKIEVVCNYYGHPDLEDEAAYAHFNDIALTSFEASNGFNYSYDSETGNLVRKENSQYWENYQYDSENRLISVDNSYNESYLYEYTENDDGTSEYSESYSKNGLLVSKSVYTYNSYGLLTSVRCSGTVGDGASLDEQEEVYYITTAYEYEETSGSKIFGALISETDTLGNQTTYEYNENNGWLLYSIHLPSKTGYKYEYFEDGTLWVVRPITINGSNIFECPEWVSYSYYTKDMLSYIRTRSTEYYIGRNNYGNTAEIEIGDRTLATYEYYPNNGKLKKINYGNGFSEEYVYNALEMLEEVWYTYDDGTTEQAFSYTYNHDGTLSVVTNLLEGKDTKYEYDNNGRLIGVYEKDTDETDYIEVYSIDYDADGKVSSQIPIIRYGIADSTIPKELSTSYEYNTTGALSSETHGYLSNYHKINYEYDGFNRLSTVNKNLGCFNYSTTYSYVTNGSNTSYRVNGIYNIINDVSSYYHYTYDSKGNITQAIVNNDKITYTYDSLDQLTRENNEQSNKTYIFKYDDAGNLTTKETYPLTFSDVIIDAPLSTDSYTYGDTDWGDLLTSYNGTTITYDEIGNPLTYYNGSAYTFTWTGRQLTEAVKGSKTMSFTYDDTGIRTSKTVNGVTHTYQLNGSQIISEQWDDKLLVYLYDASGSPIGMMYRTTSYELDEWNVFWYEKNLQGDVVAVYNSMGQELVNYSYDAWGNQTVTYWNGGGTTPAQYNPFRYRGYYYDTALGMYYLQSRYYDAKICRFINADVYISTGYGLIGNNMFAYCNNNPVCYSDHEGTDISYECLGEENDYNPTNDWRYEGGGSVGGNSNGASSAGSTYTSPTGGGGSTDSININGTTIDFGHGGRHLSSTNLSVADVNKAIANDVIFRPPTMGVVGHGSVNVQGFTIGYNYYTRSPNLICVGTYHIER